MADNAKAENRKEIKKEIIVKAENLCFDYIDEEDQEEQENQAKAVQVLKNISTEIYRGEFVAVLGHNGSGKSTFAKHINAIFTPKSGKMYVNGMDTSDQELLFDIRKTAGMVFQNPDNQMVANIVEDDVAFAPENLGVEREEIRRRVDDALAAVNMTSFAKHAPHMLSGGQKQRVAIAGVLAMRPQIIILDEPTAMLDPGGRAEVMETMKKLNREQGITVILITHYMDEAVMADRVIVMDDGIIKMTGKPKEIFSKVKELKNLGLDVPQATELSFLLKEKGLDIKADVLDENECADEIFKIWKAAQKS